MIISFYQSSIWAYFGLSIYKHPGGKPQLWQQFHWWSWDFWVILWHMTGCHRQNRERIVHASWRWQQVEECKQGKVTDLVQSPVGHSTLETLLGRILFQFSLSGNDHLSMKQNHSNAVSLIPSISSIRFSKISWSIKSNAALRSSSMSITASPLSMPHRISFWILRRAVSVEWNCL